MTDKMKLIINISKDIYTRLFDSGIQDNEIAIDDVCEMARALRMGKPLVDVTDEQISDAFLNAIANYWEEKSKYLTPPPTPAQCPDCLNEKSGVFVSRPIEVVKMGEPLSNSDEIRAALEKGELYRRGFKDAMKRYKRPTGKWKHIIEEDNDVECPFCGFQEDGIYYNFCPSCGADMMKGSVEE